MIVWWWWYDDDDHSDDADDDLDHENDGDDIWGATGEQAAWEGGGGGKEFGKPPGFLWSDRDDDYGDGDDDDYDSNDKKACKQPVLFVCISSFGRRLNPVDVVFFFVFWWE